MTAGAEQEVIAATDLIDEPPLERVVPIPALSRRDLFNLECGSPLGDKGLKERVDLPKLLFELLSALFAVLSEECECSLIATRGVLLDVDLLVIEEAMQVWELGDDADSE